MAKCNYCGSTTRKIVYNHGFEPKACSICTSQYFVEGGDGITPLEYNKVAYYAMLRQLGTKARNNMLMKLNSIFESYVTRELRFAGVGTKLRIIFKTEHRKQYGIIVIEADVLTGQIKDLLETKPLKIQQIMSGVESGMPIF